MKNLDQLKRQHIEIFEVLKETKELIRDGNYEENSQVIAKNISNLAGKLQMHLLNEDRFLYPSFLKSENKDLKSKAEAYTSEMGGLSDKYKEFKTKFNTKNKILADINLFKSESRNVFMAIEKRINKEDNDLYKIAEKL
jgi:iron-sulfur cluster repair protein YtfE (RIC family)